MTQTNNDNLNPGSSGSTGTGSTASGSSFGSGGTGTGMSSGGGMSTGSGTGTPFGTTSASDRGAGVEKCAHCGATKGSGLEEFLGRLGITDEMMNNLKGQFQNVDIDEYLNTARTYLKDGSGKATEYAKENPGKVAAGVAALALGAGLLYAAVNRDK